MKKELIALLLGVSAAFSAHAEGKRFLTLEGAAIAQSKKWRETGVAKPIMSDDGRVLYPFGQYLPTLTCTLLRACDIQLEPGELMTGQPVAGDTARFLITKRTSGAGEAATTHIVVKPTEASIETNLILYTDRRVYQIKLSSTSDDRAYVNAIGFYYPEAVVQEWDESMKLADRKKKEEAKRAETQIPGNCVQNLDFAYKIEGGTSFKPTRVYSACGKVYIHLPEQVSTAVSPVLVSIGKDGNAEFLNWRPKSATIYEVDKLFDKAMLVVGNDDDEQKITITWTKSEKKSWFSWANEGAD